MSKSNEPASDTYEPERVIPTDVPGLVIWQGERKTFTVKGQKKRSHYYSVTHEPSGTALMPGGSGNVKVVLTVAEAKKIAAQLGDVHWRGKPFDWTQPFDVVWKNERAKWACMTVAGWRMVLDHYDKATKEWAERNGISLAFGKSKEAANA